MDFKQKIKMVRILEKNFEEKEEEEKSKILEENRKFFQDPSGVIGISPKTIEMQELFTTFFETSNEHKMPKINYEGTDGIENKSVYPADFLLFINELISVSSEQVKTFMKKDKPIKFETEDFIVYLAPQVDDR